MTVPTTTGATQGWAAAGAGFVTVAAPIAAAVPSITKVLRISPSSQIRRAFAVEAQRLTDAEFSGSLSLINFVFNFIQIFQMPASTVRG
jgi:hypothetical protein